MYKYENGALSKQEATKPPATEAAHIAKLEETVADLNKRNAELTEAVGERDKRIAELEDALKKAQK